MHPAARSATHIDTTSSPADRGLDDDPESLTLWRLWRRGDTLRCRAAVTSFGCAIAIELSGELILFQLEPDAEQLVDKAASLETSLSAKGWRTTPEA
jgi:hypothetical protein